MEKVTVANPNVLRWVGALRSGKYKQGKGVLQSRRESGVLEHCCLGVGETLRITDAGDNVDVIEGRPLPKVSPFAHWLGFTDLAFEGEVDSSTSDWNPTIDIPAEAADELRALWRALWYVDDREHWSDEFITDIAAGKGAQCGALNDDSPLGFAEIADLIEKYGIREPFPSGKSYCH